MNVHILATCRKPELLRMTILVFATLRVGFPNARVKVSINPSETDCLQAIRLSAASTGCEWESVSTIHHEWIYHLINTQNEPFFLCDTDIIFYENVEGFTSEEALCGWRIPEFVDEFSGAVTRSRLHPSLLYIDPAQVRHLTEKFASTLPPGPFTPLANPVYPLCLPFRQRMYFHDTMSLMYHAIGGQDFTDKQKDAYYHAFFGTIPDLVLPRLNPEDGAAIVDERVKVVANPELGRGAWRERDLYFKSRAL